MIGDVLQVLVLLAVVIGYFHLARRAENNLYLIFAALSTATLMISTVYYVTHSFLREGMRVPFAANDIADFGTFLLMSAALRSALGTGKGRLRGVMLGAAAFAVANVCLWICWSGEWVRDILGGLSFGYFICVCIRSVYECLRETGLILRCDRKVGNPFQTKQGSLPSCPDQDGRMGS